MFKRVLKGYFFSWWLPPLSALLIFGLFFLNETGLRFRYAGLVLLVALIGSCLGIFTSGIVQLIKGRKLWGVINLLSLPVVGFVVVWGLSFLLIRAMFDETPDDFGKDIVIPADMEVSEPVENFSEPGGAVADKLTTDIVSAFTNNQALGASAKISTDLSILNEFGTTNRQKLIEYLAANPRWFVTEEDGKPYAYRRFVVGGRWENSLNGFYSSSDIARSFEPHFQTRVVVGFDGPVFAGPFRKKQTTAQLGTGEVMIQVFEDREFSQGKESYFILQSSTATVEIFEQSSLDSRPVTQLALAEIKRELEAGLTGDDPTSLPPPPLVEEGGAVIQLAKGMQGGIYQVRAFVNPGEAGWAYLKVFEATKNTPLSAERIKPQSISKIGWSTNAIERFRYQSEITIYEGEWGNFYPGRFELWFIPDSGKPERKLVDQIFRIEGWMR